MFGLNVDFVIINGWFNMDLIKYCLDNKYELNDQLIPKEWDDRNWVEDPLEVLSYGGGTQSSAMLLMMADGSIPKADIVIHSDTGAEMPETVAFMKVAREYVENTLKIPFVVCNSHLGTIYEEYMRLGAIPMIGARSCTDKFKIRPQRRLIRSIVGSKSGVLLANSMLGITTDEAKRRVDQADVKWLGLKYPLLDDRPTTRSECIDMNMINGWDIGKSGCYICPYMGSNSWNELKRDHPKLFELAVELEEHKFEVRGGKIGLFQYNRLSEIEGIHIDDSKCDSGAGCFL